MAWRRPRTSGIFIVVIRVSTDHAHSLILKLPNDANKRFRPSEVMQGVWPIKKHAKLIIQINRKSCFQPRNAQRSKNFERWDSTRKENKDALVPTLPVPACCRVNLNAMSKVKVSDARKHINLHVDMMLVLNKVKRQDKTKNKGFWCHGTDYLSVFCIGLWRHVIDPARGRLSLVS